MGVDAQPLGIREAVPLLFELCVLLRLDGCRLEFAGLMPKEVLAVQAVLLF